MSSFFAALGDAGSRSLFGDRTTMARQFVLVSGGHVVVVRASEERGERRLAATRADDRGHVEAHYERALSFDEWARLEQAVKKADLPHTRPILTIDRFQKMWALEVATAATYRLVIRSDPEPALRAACDAFLDVDARYIARGVD